VRGREARPVTITAADLPNLRGEPEERAAVLGRDGGTDEPLSRPDRGAGYHDPRTNRLGRLSSTHLGPGSGCRPTSVRTTLPARWQLWWPVRWT
jgi:hypothetical protein